jgi:hypothetical protein
MKDQFRHFKDKKLPLSLDMNLDWSRQKYLKWIPSLDKIAQLETGRELLVDPF